MEQNVTILVQLAPAAGAETILLAINSTEKAFIQEIAVCNRSAVPSSFRLSISPLGAATATKDYLYYDLPIGGNDSFGTELELTLNSRDVIRIYAGTATLSFTVIGART